MKWNSHKTLASVRRQPSDSQIAQAADVKVCRFACVRASDWCRVGVILTFAWLLLINAGNVFGQQRSKAKLATSTVSSKQKLVSEFQALRAASVERESVAEPEEKNEMFLDLSNGASSEAPETDSNRTTAPELGVSMSSSPTQVLMRAVAWIAIVLCVCCLGILGARRWQRERGLLPTVSSRSKVIETLSLGPSRTVSLIEMHGYRALVATDAGGIRSLVLAPSPFEDSLMQEADTHDAATKFEI